MCCSAFQCVAVRRSASQCVAVRCSVLQCVAVRRNALANAQVCSAVNAERRRTCANVLRRAYYTYYTYYTYYEHLHMFCDVQLHIHILHILHILHISHVLRRATFANVLRRAASRGTIILQIMYIKYNLTYFIHLTFIFVVCYLHVHAHVYKIWFYTYYIQILCASHIYVVCLTYIWCVPQIYMLCASHMGWLPLVGFLKW